jgi:hypothetical protein
MLSITMVRRICSMAAAMCGVSGLLFTIVQGLRRYVAKIGESNAASQRLFQRLGFTETGRSAVFKEITYEILVDDAVREDLDRLGKAAAFGHYDDMSTER